MKQCSIVEARDAFAGIVHSVESDGPVEFTRRGHPVAVLLSSTEYRRLTEQPVSFVDAYEDFRESYDLDALDIDPSVFCVERDRYID